MKSSSSQIFTLAVTSEIATLRCQFPFALGLWFHPIEHPVMRLGHLFIDAPLLRELGGLLWVRNGTVEKAGPEAAGQRVARRVTEAGRRGFSANRAHCQCVLARWIPTLGSA
jgi:hypothetical protein